MKKKDTGTIHKLFACILLMWVVICWVILLEVMRAGYLSRHLEDSITQANLATILIEPYCYGSSGVLAFEDVGNVKRVFADFIEKALGSVEERRNLGITGDVEIVDFRAYEVIPEVTTEFYYDDYTICRYENHDKTAVVVAPDGTIIQNTSIYAKVAVPVRFLFGIEITVAKEHCVDVVSEEMIYE